MNLQAVAGTAISITGGNGAGKTTLLRIATGILAPDSGTVTVDGVAAGSNWREYHRRVGFLSAGDRGLYPRLTVLEHLHYWAALAFVPRARRREAVQEISALFGLGGLHAHRADRLSQGQRQRLRLALAFVHKPKVLLLDEPRNSLDADGLELFAGAVRNSLARGGTVIAVSPAGEDLPIAFDRHYALHGGRLTPC